MANILYSDNNKPLVKSYGAPDGKWSEVDLFSDGIGKGWLYGDADGMWIGPWTASTPLVLGDGIGHTLAQSPSTAPIGAVAVINDSVSNEWGAVVAGGGTKRVFAWFNGTAWTVLGK